jgi:site-specific DNA-adenine methylase
MEPYLAKASFYYEPFMGGCNLLCHVPHECRIGSDVNPYLVALLSKVRDDPSCLPDSISEEEYVRVSRNRGSYPDWYVGMVAFCATYRGLFWGGYARDEGGARSRQLLDNLRKQAPLLKGVELRCVDFRRVNIKGFPKGGLILADIPYKGASGYKFRFDHDEFYRWCGYVHSLGHTVLLTEFWAPSVFREIAAVERLDSLSVQRPGDVAPVVTERLFIFCG